MGLDHLIEIQVYSESKCKHNLERNGDVYGLMYGQHFSQIHKSQEILSLQND